MSWLFFAVAAPALYGASVFVDKFLIDKHLKSPVSLVSIGGGVSLLFALSIPVFGNFHPLPWPPAFLVLLSGALVQLGLLPYLRAISLEDASRVMPLFSITPILVLVFSYLFLGETLSGLQLAGFALVLLGGFLLSLKELSWRVFAVRRSLKFVLLAGVCFAAAAVLFKFIVDTNDFWSTLFYELIGAELVTLSFFLIGGLRRRIWQDMRNLSGRLWAIFIGNETIYLAGRLSGFYAYALAPVSLVSVAGQTQPFFSLIYGLVLSLWFPRILAEDIRRRTLVLKLVCMLLIFAGLWLINAA